MIVRELIIGIKTLFDQKSADDAEKKTNALASNLNKVLGFLVAKQTFGWMTDMLDQASKYEDSLNVMRQTFGSFSGDVEGWAEQQADQLGRSKASLIEYAAGLGSVLVPSLKGNREEAAKMATQLSQLSVDLGSFYHQADDETMGRLRAAMLGSSEAVDQLGINLKSEALAAFAAEKGIKGYSSKASEQIKMQVRFAKIMADSTDKIGWAAKTGKEYDNSVRKLKENLKDLSITIGQKLLKPAGVMVDLFQRGAVKMGEFVRNSYAVEVALTALGVVASAMALRWALMNIPLLLTIGFLGALFLILEDIYTGLNEGQSVIGRWFESIAGKEAWQNAIDTWKAGKKALDDIMAGKSVSDVIFDYVNPNNALGDQAAMDEANAMLKAHDFARSYDRSGTGAGGYRIPTGTGYGIPSMQITSAAAKNANRPGPWAAGLSTGPIIVNVAGNATPAVAQEIGRAVKNGLEQRERELYRTTGRFDITRGGTGSITPSLSPAGVAENNAQMSDAERAAAGL